jgi:hypothetical protein
MAEDNLSDTEREMLRTSGVEKVVKMVKPFETVLCPLPPRPAPGDVFACPHPHCHTQYEALLVPDGRVVWYCTWEEGGCLHPFDRCEPVDEPVAVGMHHVVGAYECLDCGSWVVPLGEPVLTI